MRPRQLTEDEVRDALLEHIHAMARYWATVGGPDGPKTCLDRLEGLAFSILAALDGNSVNVPGFIVAPLPHEDDKQYRIDQDENYYPENHRAKIRADIGGSLHEHWHDPKYRRHA